jgi:signal transduction histidine kinase/HAMP domain-containing protein
MYFRIEKHENEDFAIESINKLVEEKSRVLSQDLKRVETEVLNLGKWLEYELASYDEVILISYIDDNGLLFDSDDILTTSEKFYEDLQLQTDNISTYVPRNDKISKSRLNNIIKLQQFSSHFITSQNRLSDMSWIYFITPDDLMFLTPSSPLEGFGYSHDFQDDIYYSIAIPENNPERKLLWTNPYTDWLGNGWTITCSYPIYVDDKFLGVLSSDITSQNISSAVSDFRLSDSGFAFLINNGGNVIYHPDSETISQDKGTPLSMNLMTEQQNIEYENILMDMIEGNSGFENYTNTSDDNLHAIAYTGIENSNWSLGLEVNWEMYKNITGLSSSYIFNLILLSICIFMVIGFILYQLILVPINKLVDHTYLIKSGDYSQRIHTNSQTEIGILEMSINNMTDSISNHTKNLKYKTREIEAVFNSYPQIMMKIDKYFNIMLMNSKGMDIVDNDSHSHENIIGSKCYEIIFNRMEPCTNCPKRSTKSSNSEVIREITQDNQLYRITSLPILNKESKVKEWVIFNSNITDKYLLEQSLVQREKMAGIGQMMAGVTHELKNPLTVIKGAEHLMKLTVSEIKSDEDTKKEMNQIFKVIDESIDRSEKIINNLLDFSRKSTHDTETVDLNNILDQVLLIEGYSIRKNKVNLITNYEIDRLKINSNRDILKQIFINIISNAIHALPEEKPELVISTYTNEDRFALVSIKDNGSGISKEIVDKVFEPFFSTKEKEGHGLGLWIVKREMDKLDGEIKVNSIEGKGTEFILKFKKIRIS